MRKMNINYKRKREAIMKVLLILNPLPHMRKSLQIGEKSLMMLKMRTLRKSLQLMITRSLFHRMTIHQLTSQERLTIQATIISQEVVLEATTEETGEEEEETIIIIKMEVTIIPEITTRVTKNEKGEDTKSPTIKKIEMRRFKTNHLGTIGISLRKNHS